MVCHTMATLISLLMLLCLFSCSDQLKLKGPEVTPGFTGLVKLECQPDRVDLMDFGVFWFRQRKDSKNPESILFLSSTKKPTYSNDQEKKGFLADKIGSAYTLTITSFHQTFQATYYCMINKNSVLYISPGFILAYPEVQVITHKPTTTKVSAPDIATKGAGGTCDCSAGKPDSPQKEGELFGFTCDLYVWGPLTGLCGLLLICLMVTSIMLCCRTRRRRCRCKHKPLEENNGKLNAPRIPR